MVRKDFSTAVHFLILLLPAGAAATTTANTRAVSGAFHAAPASGAFGVRSCSPDLRSSSSRHRQQRLETSSRIPLVRLSAVRKRRTSGDQGDGSSSSEVGAASASSRSIDPAKKAALDNVMNQIERNYGRGSIMQLGDADHMNIETISSGSLTLDMALGGGGYPRGRVVEIYGPESGGKTTLALHAIAECQKSGGENGGGGIAAFIDAEHALQPDYAASIGVDVKNLLVSQPESGEMALDIVDQLVRSAAVDLIVVDSVAALVPRAELEGDMSDAQIGLQARLMSKAMRKITGSLAMSRCTIIFINQLRSKVGVIYGSPEVTSGGNALKFYSSIRLDTRRKETLPDNSGIRIKVKVVKNKISSPFKTVMLDIKFGSGIDNLGSIFDAAMDLDVVERRGSWYAYRGRNLSQGRMNVLDLLQNDEQLTQQLEQDVREQMSKLLKGDSDSSTSANTTPPRTSVAEPTAALQDSYKFSEESYLD